MTKNLTLSFFIAFMFNASSAQNHKTYSGVFETHNASGNAKYQYFDNDEGERTFDGNFKFFKLDNSVSIEGRFENNFKTGLWKLKFINYLASDLMLKYNINCTSIGTYLNGKLNGNWNLQRTIIFSASNNGLSQYYKSHLNSFSYLFEGKKIDFSKKQAITETAIVNFSDNHFAGDFLYSVNNGTSKVKGQFNSEGLLQGSWVITYTNNGIPIEERYLYLNGVLLTIKRMNISTGELQTLYDDEVAVREFFINFNAQENISYTKNGFYNLDRVEPKNEGNLIDQALSMWVNNNIFISKSSYAFEVKQGVIKMTNYPQRIIVINEKRNEKKQREDDRNVEELKNKQERMKYERQLQIEKEEAEKIHTIVENDASFPGGNGGWNRYIEKNLIKNTPLDNGAPKGNYVVVVRFVVSKDGSVSDVQAETKFGYGMEDEAVKLIKNGPKWTPALSNGRNVNAYRRQSITFNND